MVMRTGGWGLKLAVLCSAVFAAALMGLSLAGTTTAAGGVDWPTYGYDLARTGYNPNETTLTLAKVPQLTQIWSRDSFGPIYGQPVLATGVTVNGQSKDLILVGNTSGWAAAMDAATGAIVWRIQFGTTVATCPAGNVTVGITGTPVIDRATNRVYFVDGAAKAYALDLATGATVIGWPVTISTIPGKEQTWGA